jgi:selenide,water dikinase
VKFEKGVNVMEAFTLLPDPQTNGGLLISIAPQAAEKLKDLFRTWGLHDHLEEIGSMIAPGEKRVFIQP